MGPTRRQARRPATETELIAVLRAEGCAGEFASELVQSLVADRWLVERTGDLGELSALDLGPAADPSAIGRDRLQWCRDALDPHALWLYPRWLGFAVMQLPADLIGMQMLLTQTRPAFLVETGLAGGGGAVFYASIFSLLGRGHVVAVEARPDPEVRAAIAAHPLGARITVIEGDSADPATVAKVADLIGGAGEHVVVLDSDHSTEHVRAEMEAYAPLLQGAGKLVVFDTSMQLVGRWADDNPHRAVRGFLTAHEDWRVSPWAGVSFITAAEDGILERLPE